MKNQIEIVDAVPAVPAEVQITGMNIATKLAAVIPNALADPIQRYHEKNIEKDLTLAAMDHQTDERSKILDVVIELARTDGLDDSKFQMLMSAYIMKRF